VDGKIDGFEFISYYPLKQGLKPIMSSMYSWGMSQIYRQSKQTLIETHNVIYVFLGEILFISYYPLKQGLKRVQKIVFGKEKVIFISYYPLKQGLKHHILDLPQSIDSNLYPTIH